MENELKNSKSLAADLSRAQEQLRTATLELEKAKASFSQESQSRQSEGKNLQLLQAENSRLKLENEGFRTKVTAMESENKKLHENLVNAENHI